MIPNRSGPCADGVGQIYPNRYRRYSGIPPIHKFIDVVVYDALVCNSSWFNHCIHCEVAKQVRAGGCFAVHLMVNFVILGQMLAD